MRTKRKDNMFNAVLVKQDGKLIHRNQIDHAVYKAFMARLEEGQMVEIFLDANKDDGTLAQLAKAHKCIRELAMTLGYSFEDMKFEIKHKAGLCVKKEIEGEMFMVCKSFSRCSKDELSLVIQAIIEIGDFNGMNFR